MTTPLKLPEPDAAAREHSRALTALITSRIEAAGGWLSFADYMGLALYAPGLGYYSAGAAKLGPEGDFVTAPELTPLFGRCIARMCRRALSQLGGGCIVEAGGGSGALAAAILDTLAGAPPERYFILEVSADFRARQRATLEARVPKLLPRVEWLDQLPAPGSVRGVILANEVLDALPVERFRRHGGALESCGVGVSGEGFHWLQRPAPGALADGVATLETHLGHRLPDGYTSEVSLSAGTWVGSLAETLEAGLLLLMDYGGSPREVYHPQRSDGTLVCHYRHRAHADPFFWPGLQDITAWVDFARVAAAGQDAGLSLAAYGTQAHFLLAAGILDELGRLGTSSPEALKARQAVQQLLLPGEMGERFKVMLFSRGPLSFAGELMARDLRAGLRTPRG